MNVFLVKLTGDMKAEQISGNNIIQNSVGSQYFGCRLEKWRLSDEEELYVTFERTIDSVKYSASVLLIYSSMCSAFIGMIPDEVVKRAGDWNYSIEKRYNIVCGADGSVGYDSVNSASYVMQISNSVAATGTKIISAEEIVAASKIIGTDIKGIILTAESSNEEVGKAVEAIEAGNGALVRFSFAYADGVEKTVGIKSYSSERKTIRFDTTTAANESEGKIAEAVFNHRNGTFAVVTAKRLAFYDEDGRRIKDTYLSSLQTLTVFGAEYDGKEAKEIRAGDDLTVSDNTVNVKKATPEDVAAVIEKFPVPVSVEEKLRILLSGYTARSTFELNEETYVLTQKNYNANGELISTASVDFPLEMAFVSADVDEAGESITFTLQNGETVNVPVSAMIKNYVTVERLNEILRNYATTGDFVKRTDYAAGGSGVSRLGLVKADEWSRGGIQIDKNSGLIAVYSALQNHISNRIHNTAITTNNFDFAVKAAMCDGKGAAWTEEEQSAARARMGIAGIENLTIEEVE